MEERKNKVSKLIPQLLSFTNLLDKKPQIRYFEGSEGIKEVLKDTLDHPEQEICMLYSIKEFEDNFFSEYYVPERIKRKISARALLPDNAAMRELSSHNQRDLRQSKFISPALFSFNITIMIYGKNKINMVSYEEKFGLIIESQAIHDSLKSLFETMWATSAKEA